MSYQSPQLLRRYNEHLSIAKFRLFSGVSFSSFCVILQVKNAVDASLKVLRGLRENPISKRDLDRVFILLPNNRVVASKFVLRSPNNSSKIAEFQLWQENAALKQRLTWVLTFATC